MDFASFAHGPCWEPTISHFSIAMSYVTGKAKDPSPPLAWWDKLRLLTHGRLLVSVKTLKLQLHTTLGTSCPMNVEKSLSFIPPKLVKFVFLKCALALT